MTPTDYLGWGQAGIAGYYGTASGRDLNEPSLRGSPGPPEPKPARFAVNYHLLALARRLAPRPRAGLGRRRRGGAQRRRRVWPTADWHEREAFDLMGIVFDGHPNLKRLIMEDDWDGHPLRKDYPDRRRAGPLLGSGVDGDGTEPPA